MRNILLKGVAGAAMLAVLGSPVDAADLPEPAPVYVPVPAVIYTWTGFYVGVHAGAGWVNHDGNNDHDRDDDGFIVSSLFDWDDDDDDDGDDDMTWLFGAQAGYNWQTGNFVFGIEADVSWSSFESKRHHDYAWDASPLDGPADAYLGTGDGRTTFKVESDWLSTIRARAGLAYDRWLLYVTGGAAVTSVDVSLRDRGDYVANPGQITPDNDSYAWDDKWDDDTTLWGWTVGVGVEGMITPNITARIEYLYINFDEDDFDFDDLEVLDHKHGVDIDAHVIRAGLNYKFDW